MRILQFFRCLMALSFAILLAVDSHANSEKSEPSKQLLQHVAKIDACAMALDQVDKKLSQALQIKAEILMKPYYTDELDAMDDSEYNQIPWVQTYNGYFIDEQKAFFQHGSPEFAQEAAKQNYRKNCVIFSKKVLQAT